MSLHRSLKTKSGALEAHRSVLSRPERIAKLKSQGKFTEGDDDPIHLPKVRNIKVATKKKKPAKEEEAAVEGAEAPAAEAEA